MLRFSAMIDQVHATPFCSLSAIQTLMMDCRVTPRRLASLSKRSIIHAGKSTLTRLCSLPGLLARERSRNFEISSPPSNFLSSSLAFINLDILFPRSPDRDNADLFIAIRDNRRPMIVAYFTDEQISRLICISSAPARSSPAAVFPAIRRKALMGYILSQIRSLKKCLTKDVSTSNYIL